MKILDAELIASAPNIGMLPESGLPEVAFLGRSNVGKSSLLNGLTRRKKLARTSSTPGKTRDLVLFKVRTDWGEIGLVDLPGYGWAKVSRSERAGWQRMAEDYLAKREALCLAFVLQDVPSVFFSGLKNILVSFLCLKITSEPVNFSKRVLLTL